MGANTSYNRFTLAQRVLRDLFSMARSFKWTHATFLDERTKRLTSSLLYQGPKHRRLTIAQQEYLRGMGDAMSQAIVDCHCVWAFDIGAVRPLRTAEMTEREKANFYTLPGDEIQKMGHFYWKDEAGNPTKKYWF